MKTGRLDQRIGIYITEKQDDGFGGKISAPVLYWDTWAHVRTMRSFRVEEANAPVMKDVYEFTIRNRSDKEVRKGMLILYRGQWFTNVSDLPDYRDKIHIAIRGEASNG